MFFQLIETNIGLVIAFLLSIAIGISIHEFSHALAAYLMGDTTARDAGRLTLNPLAHLDPLGSFMLLFAGFGWGKPTPYNPHQLRFLKWGPALVAIAGPASNLIGAAGSIGLLALIRPYLSGENLLVLFLGTLFLVNVMLMLFNLIPIPPLDGSQLLFSVIPARFENLKYFLARNGPIVLIALLIMDNFVGVGFFGSIYRYFLNIIARFL